MHVCARRTQYVSGFADKFLFCLPFRLASCFAISPQHCMVLACAEISHCFRFIRRATEGIQLSKSLLF